MTAFYFAFLAVILAGLGARDQGTVAVMALRQGQRPGLLLISLASSLTTAAFAAWTAAMVAPLLMSRARLVLAAFALAAAGFEALWPFVRRHPQEPTASLSALLFVLLAHQLTDAARFLIFAIAAAQAAPVAAAIGGAAGGAAVPAAAWLLPESFADLRLRQARRAIGVMLLLSALIVAYRALSD